MTERLKHACELNGWTECETVRAWNGDEVVIGRDTEGDIGIIDVRNYSIIIDKSEAKKLAGVFCGLAQEASSAGQISESNHTDETK